MEMESEKYILQLKEFGDKIRQIREKHGMSQLDLAAVTGLEQRHISAIENGKQNVQFSTISTLAEGLGVELHDLFPPPNK